MAMVFPPMLLCIQVSELGGWRPNNTMVAQSTGKRKALGKRTEAVGL
jgi:hypothetical protein